MYQFKLKNNIKINVSKESFDNWFFNRTEDFIKEEEGNKTIYIKKEDIVMGFKFNTPAGFEWKKEPNKYKESEKTINITSNDGKYTHTVELMKIEPAELKTYKGYGLLKTYGDVKILGIWETIREIRLEVSNVLFQAHIKDEGFMSDGFIKSNPTHYFNISFEDFDKHIDPLISKYKENK